MKLLSGLEIRLYPEKSQCSICGRKTKVLKTDRKTCYSFGLGKFILISGCAFCSDHKRVEIGRQTKIIRYESNLATMLVEKGFRVTFDLLVKIGRMRYDDHRQLEEIQSYLKCSSARIDLPLSTVSLVAKRFLESCKNLHEANEATIIRDIAINGGYFLHFDGSTEQKCGQCSLVFMDSRSGHILDSSMVKSESYDTIKQSLEKIKAKFGTPLVVVSDLRPGFVRVCRDVFGKEVKHILCHYHFLRTFKDEFNEDHQFIKTCITQKWQLQSGLSKQLKALGNLKVKPQGSAKELKTIGEIEDCWRKTGDTLGAYRDTLRWILNYKQQSSGKGVPFDLPFVDLYHRLLAGNDLIDRIFAAATGELRMKYYLHGFCAVQEKTNNLGHNEAGFRKALNHLQYAKKWFQKLRAVLYLEGQSEEDRDLAPLSKMYHLTTEEAEMIPLRLSGFLQSVTQELSCCKHPDRRAFLEKMQGQVKKYRPNLRLPTNSITIDGKESLLVPPRTNNCMETQFRYIKSLLRRCTGRCKLPKEFGSVGALLPYYLTMRAHPSFKAIFQNDQSLADEFARIVMRESQSPQNVIAFPKRPEKSDEPVLAGAMGA